VPVEVDLRAVVDLRDPAIQTALQLTAHNLAMNFRAIPAEVRSRKPRNSANAPPPAVASMAFFTSRWPCLEV